MTHDWGYSKCKIVYIILLLVIHQISGWQYHFHFEIYMFVVSNALFCLVSAGIAFRELPVSISVIHFQFIYY